MKFSHQKNLSIYLAHIGDSNADFIKKTSINKNNVYNYLDQKIEYPRMDFILKTKNTYPDLNLNWWLCNQGTMQLDSEGQVVAAKISEQEMNVLVERMNTLWKERTEKTTD